MAEIKTLPSNTLKLLYCSSRSSSFNISIQAGSDPRLVLVPQQLVQDAGLFQHSELGDVLCEDGDVAMATGLAVAIIAVRQRAEERVVLVGGEVVPEESRAGSEPLWLYHRRGNRAATE